jgi:hypothetical protein
MDLHDPIRPALRDLAATLGRSSSADLARFPGFPPVDAEAIAEDLDLYVQAAEAGQRGEPAAHSEGPDPIETAIATVVEARARDGMRLYASHLTQHDRAVRGAFLRDAEAATIETSCQDLLEEFDGHIRDTQTRMMEFWGQRVEPIEAEFQGFRAHYGLERPPRLVSRTEKCLRGLVLAALGATAVLVHLRFLGDASVASALSSFAWSLGNVGAAVWFARRGLPALVGRGFGSKLRGVVGTCLYLGWTLATNLLAAHQHDVWGAPAADPSWMGLWRHVTLAPLGVEAAGSWLLALLGIAWSAAATCVAVGLDDIHPGYGAVGKQRGLALEAYSDEVAACSQHLAELQKSAEADLQATVEAVHSREYQASAAAAARSEFHGELSQYFAELASAQAHLVRRYREINAAVQNGAVPLYFLLDVEPPACLADPGLATPPRPENGWDETIARLQQRAASVASMLAEAPLPRLESVPSEPTEARVEVQFETEVPV